MGYGKWFLSLSAAVALVTGALGTRTQAEPTAPMASQSVCSAVCLVVDERAFRDQIPAQVINIIPVESSPSLISPLQSFNQIRAFCDKYASNKGLGLLVSEYQIRSIPVGQATQATDVLDPDNYKAVLSAADCGQN